MSLLSQLFGKSYPKPAEPVMYDGYTITPQPIKEGHVYRLSAMVENDGQSHHLIRADTLPSVEACLLYTSPSPRD